jgi:hypothetical protein
MSAGIETLPEDYQARAKALRAKFFNAAPVVVSREKPRIVDVSKLTFDAVRKVGAVVYHGRVYGPHPLPRDFLHVTAQGYEFTRSPTRLRIEEIKREVAEKHGIPVSLLAKQKRGYKDRSLPPGGDCAGLRGISAYLPPVARADVRASRSHYRFACRQKARRLARCGS